MITGAPGSTAPDDGEAEALVDVVGIVEVIVPDCPTGGGVVPAKPGTNDAALAAVIGRVDETETMKVCKLMVDDEAF